MKKKQTEWRMRTQTINTEDTCIWLLYLLQKTEDRPGETLQTFDHEFHEVEM